jgi:hypothetical protein
MNGPIGKTVSFLCFNPDTMVVLAEMKAIPMKNLQPGNKLYTGETVTSVYKVDATGVDMYHLHGIVVSGNHKVKYQDTFIPVKEHPSAIKIITMFPYLSCFNTDTHRIHLGGIEFLDFIECEKTLPSIPSDMRIELLNGNKISIEFAKIGMVLHSGSRIIGIVNRKDGYQLITTSHQIMIVSPTGMKSIVKDELANAI